MLYALIALLAFDAGAAFMLWALWDRIPVIEDDAETPRSPSPVWN